MAPRPTYTRTSIRSGCASWICSTLISSALGLRSCLRRRLRRLGCVFRDNCAGQLHHSSGLIASRPETHPDGWTILLGVQHDRAVGLLHIADQPPFTLAQYSSIVLGDCRCFARTEECDLKCVRAAGPRHEFRSRGERKVREDSECARRLGGRRGFRTTGKKQDTDQAEPVFLSAHAGEISGSGALPQAGVALMFPHTAGPFPLRKYT